MSAVSSSKLTAFVLFSVLGCNDGDLVTSKAQRSHPGEGSRPLAAATLLMLHPSVGFKHVPGLGSKGPAFRRTSAVRLAANPSQASDKRDGSRTNKKLYRSSGDRSGSRRSDAVRLAASPSRLLGNRLLSSLKRAPRRRRARQAWQPTNSPRRDALSAVAVAAVAALAFNQEIPEEIAPPAGPPFLPLPVARFALPLERLPKGVGVVGGEYVTCNMPFSGRKINVLLDTGYSGDLIITPDAAIKFNATDVGSKQLASAYEQTSTAIVEIPGVEKISKTGEVVKQQPVQALMADIPQIVTHKQVDGISGIATLWESYDVDLDLKSGILRLFRQGEGRKLAIQTQMNGMRVLPITQQVGIPAVRLVLEDGTSFMGIVDTGSDVTVANTAAAKYLGLNPDSKLGEFYGVGFSKGVTHSVAFEPGSLGFALSNGVVVELVPGGQAERLGVTPGWRADTVGNEEFTPDRLKAARASGKSFNITFAEGTLKSVTKMAPGVSLRVDRGGWNPWESSYGINPKQIAISDLANLEALAGRGNPAVLLGMDVLGNRRLMLTDGDKKQRQMWLT